MSKVAADFEKIINAGRERKKNEALAAKIFGSKGNGRSAAPNKPGTGPSLASRAGVKKRVSSGARLSAGNINGEWTHDLHGSRSTPNLRAQAQNQPRPGSLAARMHAPGTKPPGASRAANNRAAKLAHAVNRSAQSPAAASQMNIASAPAPARGITIRGLAGPFVVMAQNFAPGTTAADIESAVTPIGGIVSSCRLIKTHPIVIAEIVFESREGADNVIETLNNKTADGRLLHVYLKPAGSFPSTTPTGPRADRSHETRPGSNMSVIDGSHGFDDSRGDSSSEGGLYSDQMVPRSSINRRGRGFDGRR